VSFANTKVRDLVKTSKGKRYLKSISVPASERMEDDKMTHLDAQTPFVFWDGEGTSGKKGNKPAYVLFGSSAGHKIKRRSLSGRKCLDLLLKGKDEFPNSYHVVFAGGYDVNMILMSCMKHDKMPYSVVNRIREGMEVYWAPEGSKGSIYKMLYVHKKLFKVTRKDPDGTSHHMKLYDAFTFFGTRFTKALDEYLGPNSVPEEVSSGKAKRNDFEYADIAEIEKYWQIEGDLGRQLMEALRDRLHAVQLDVKEWHGPGAVARVLLKQNHVKEAMDTELTEKIGLASLWAYYGGRFERFRIGRAKCKVYGFDVNSAYPYALSLVPNLATASWKRQRLINPTKLKDFSLYRVRYDGTERTVHHTAPHPLPWRDDKGNIYYSGQAEGWYWGCEVKAAQEYVEATGGELEILEGWICTHTKDRPFSFAQKLYNERRRLKKLGLPEQIALKLALNSMYGKLAQQIGAKRQYGKWKLPEFHQIEWAGFATAMCRSMILRACAKSPESIIAIETDGVYSTVDLGYKDGKELGEWERTEYDDMVYLDSGIYWGRKKGQWEVARFRGIASPKTTVHDALSFLEQMPKDHGQPQPTMSSEVTLFHGMNQYLQKPTETLEQGSWCHWLPETRETSPWRYEGKRFHMKVSCRACKVGKKPSESMHDTLVINTAGTKMSARHKTLWNDGETWLGDSYSFYLEVDDTIEDEDY
jgi:hypothetical protein